MYSFLIELLNSQAQESGIYCLFLGGKSIPFIKVTSSTGNDIFRCNQYYIPPDSLVDTNDSLSLTGNNYEITKPSAGINNECYIYSDKQIFHENEQTKIYCKKKNGR